MTVSNLVLLASETIGRLRSGAETSAGSDALREAGYAGGAALYAAFADRLRASGEKAPADMTLEEFSSQANSFFAESGWGNVRLRSSQGALAVIDIDDCWEAAAGGGCHVATGVLAGFLAPLADYPVAVMEIECGSEGSASCRFLAGNAEMMDDAYDRLIAGEDWESVAASGQ